MTRLSILKPRWKPKQIGLSLRKEYSGTKEVILGKVSSLLKDFSVHISSALIVVGGLTERLWNILIRKRKDYIIRKTVSVLCTDHKGRNDFWRALWDSTIVGKAGVISLANRDKREKIKRKMWHLSPPSIYLTSPYLGAWLMLITAHRWSCSVNTWKEPRWADGKAR